jgi:hypothetical protein
VLRFRNYLGIATAGGLAVALCAVIVVPRQGSSLTASAQLTPSVQLTPAPTSEITDPAESDGPIAAPQQLVTQADLLGGGPLRTHGGDIVDAQGRVVHITGVNWFGLETGTFAPHGLWARGLDDMLDQIAQAGFNTIRLPYCNQLFDPASTPNGIDFKKNPDLQGLSGVQIMDQVIQRAGGPNDPDPAHRKARQADELLYLQKNGKPWDRALYVTTP